MPDKNQLILEAIKADAQRIIDNVARLHGDVCPLHQSRLETGVMNLEQSMMWIEKGAK